MNRNATSSTASAAATPLRVLIRDLPVSIVRGPDNVIPSNIAEDSRAVTPGSLFIARAGTATDGARFIADAIHAGASAILSARPVDAPNHVAVLTCDDVPACGAVIAERFFGSPSARLTLIGVTGTNGKTTTTYLIHQMLASAGRRCGLIGTVQTDDGMNREPSILTTPPAIELSRVMARMKSNGCTACAMEASSHALHQKRTSGLSFRIGVFTNITGDHLDYHHSMDEYLAAKAILFEGLPSSADGGVAIINADDSAGDEIARRTRARVLRCSERDRSADCVATVHEQTLTHTRSSFDGPWGRLDVHLPLLGAHNVMNAMQSLAAAHACGVADDALLQALQTCTAPPGRLEPVTSAEHPFVVLVDYAHTDDALENVLRALRPIVPPQGKLRVVFGCGGDRDRTKRPRMARVACRFADEIIITSDNPRTEDPGAIVAEVRAGVPDHRLGATTCIVDRGQAIDEAVRRGGEGDIILIAGKGHEDYQIIGTTKRPFDDRLVAKATLHRMFETAAAGAGDSGS